MSPISAITVHTPTPAPQPNTKKAAQDFEALLIGQMLKSARAGGGEWLGEDQTGAALSEMAEQQFAQMLASSGGLGLAQLVSTGLAASNAPSAQPITCCKR